MLIFIITVSKPHPGVCVNPARAQPCPSAIPPQHDSKTQGIARVYRGGPPRRPPCFHPVAHLNPLSLMKQ